MDRSKIQNDPDLDMFQQLSIRPSAGEIVTAPTYNSSESTLRKLLHPPSAVPGFDGLPTNDARSQVVLNYVEPHIMDTPTVIDTSVASPMVRSLVPADLTTFNYAILTPTGGKVFGIPFITNVHQIGGAVTMTQDIQNIDYNTSYDMTNLPSDATVYRPCYSSFTGYLNATMFNNTGMVTANQFNPSVLFGGTILSFAMEKTQQFFSFFKDMMNYHSYVDAKHPDFQLHRENFSKFPRYIQDELRIILDMPSNTFPTIDPNTTIQIADFSKSGVRNLSNPLADQVVPTPSQLMNQSLRAYTGKAEDGIFSISRLNTIAPRWMSAGNLNRGSGGSGGLYECYYYFEAPGGSVPQYRPFYDTAPPGTDITNIPIMTDTLWSTDMTWGWHVWEGLSVNPNNASLQLITKKHYRGFEAQAAAASAWAGMSRLGPKPDVNALQCTMDAFYELKDAMPAKFNFLGTIGTLIGPSLMSAGGSILKWITEKIMPSRNGSSDTAPAPITRPNASYSNRASRPPRNTQLEYRDQVMHTYYQSQIRAAARQAANTARQRTARQTIVEPVVSPVIVPAKPRRNRPRRVPAGVALPSTVQYNNSVALPPLPQRQRRVRSNTLPSRLPGRR